MFRTLRAVATGGATIIDWAIHFAIGIVLTFCGVTLALPLLVGSFLRVTGA